MAFVALTQGGLVNAEVRLQSTHLSSRYHAELVRLSTQLLEMGGLVEAQVARAIGLLKGLDPAIFPTLIEDERRINAMEREIDEALSNVIARRQPAARDLRLLMGTSKCTANLERAADEARKIGKRAERLSDDPEARAINLSEVLLAGQLALDLLRRSLDAFARMDTAAAAQVKVDDQAIDAQFRAFTTRMVPYMSANPRAIGVALDYMFVAKAIERIGDHAKNIAEFVIYVAEGKDIRHTKKRAQP
jgi:phosphate transport system protein